MTIFIVKSLTDTNALTSTEYYSFNYLLLASVFIWWNWIFNKKSVLYLLHWVILKFYSLFNCRNIFITFTILPCIKCFLSGIISQLFPIKCCKCIMVNKKISQCFVSALNLLKLAFILLERKSFWILAKRKKILQLSETLYTLHFTICKEIASALHSISSTSIFMDNSLIC